MTVKQNDMVFVFPYLTIILYRKLVNKIEKLHKSFLKRPIKAFIVFSEVVFDFQDPFTIQKLFINISNNNKHNKQKVVINNCSLNYLFLLNGAEESIKSINMTKLISPILLQQKISMYTVQCDFCQQFIQNWFGIQITSSTL